MRTIFFAILLAPMLFMAQSSYSAEFSDTAPTLTILLDNDSPFVYRDDKGYTIVVGQVANNNDNISVTNVQVSADFYDNVGVLPLESNIGSTTLEVIPPLGFSPYIIKSQSPNPAITQVSVQLEGFDSSESKQEQLTVEVYNTSYISGILSFSGMLKNSSAPILDTSIHAAFYDGFDPPRIIDVYSIPLGSIPPNESVYFNFTEKINPRAAGFYLFSESDVFYSDVVDIKMPKPASLTKLVTIKNVVITESDGDKLSEIPVGTKVNIRSESQIQFSAEQPTNETPYTYYIQVKQFGEKPYVEFIDHYDGRYIGTDTQYQSIDWIPENRGEFYIETFVWDRNNVPIAEPGPIVLISVK